MVWLIVDAWIRFDTEKAYAFSFEPQGDIDFFVPKSQIGKVAFIRKGDGLPDQHGYDMRVEAIEMSDWLAKKMADEHDLEIED